MNRINNNTHGEIIDNLFNSMSVAIRIVQEPDGYRVDINTGFGPWEAIDGGNPFPDFKAALRFSRRYKARAKTQRTYHPNMG